MQIVDTRVYTTCTPFGTGTCITVRYIPYKYNLKLPTVYVLRVGLLCVTVLSTGTQVLYTGALYVRVYICTGTE